MNAHGIHTIAVLLLAFCIFSNGQQQRKATLVDEFGEVGCEDYASRIDSWTQEVKNNPGQVGYAIVRGPKERLIQRLTHREWIRGQLILRFGKNSAGNGFLVLEGKNTSEVNVQLWRSEPEANDLLSEQVTWDLALPVKRPLEFYASQGDGGICPPIDKERVYVDILLANPGLNGNVVFHEKTFARFIERKKDFLLRLNNISRNRLRFFRSPDWTGHFELWLVPRKNR